MNNGKNAFMQKIFKNLFLAAMFIGVASTCFASKAMLTKEQEEANDPEVESFYEDAKALHQEEAVLRWGLDVFDVEGTWQEWYPADYEWFSEVDGRFQALYLDVYEPARMLLSVVNKCLKQRVLYRDSNAYSAYAYFVESIYSGQSQSICSWAAADMSDPDYTDHDRHQILGARKKIANAIICKMPEALMQAVFRMQGGRLSNEKLVIFVADMFAFIEREVVDKLEECNSGGALISTLEDSEISLDLYSAFEELLLRVVGLANSVKATVGIDSAALEVIDRCVQEKTVTLMYRLASLFQPQLTADFTAFIEKVCPRSYCYERALSPVATDSGYTTQSPESVDAGDVEQSQELDCSGERYMGRRCLPKSCIPNLRNRKARRTLIFSPDVAPCFAERTAAARIAEAEETAAIRIQEAWRAYKG